MTKIIEEKEKSNKAFEYYCRSVPWPSGIEKKRDNKEAYVHYLESISWNYWFTGTTWRELTLPSARRLANRFFDGFKKKGSLMFYASEPFDVKEGYHIHGLLKLPNRYGDLDPENKMLFQDVINRWQLVTGNTPLSGKNGKFEWSGWNRIDLQAFEPQKGAGGYCAKYILKKNADYDLLYS